MNLVGQLLTLDGIRLDLEAPGGDEVLAEIARLLQARSAIAREILLASLQSREQLGSTGVGHGVAIPHARMSRCAAPAAVFVRTRAPVAFSAPDGKPVSAFLGLIVPDKATEAHLQLLATAAAMFADRAFREKLKAAHDAAAALALFSGWTEAGAEHEAAAPGTAGIPGGAGQD